MTYLELTEIVARTHWDAWLHDADEGIWTLMEDLNVTIREIEDVRPGTIDEPWAAELGHEPARICFFGLWYGASLVKRFYFASVDGGRAFLPYPRSRHELVITPEQFGVAVVVNGERDLRDYLNRARIRVSE
jgi:hypothetical protein